MHSATELTVKYVKQLWKGEPDTHTSSWCRICKDIKELQIKITGNYRALYPTVTQHTFFSNVEHT